MKKLILALLLLLPARGFSQAILGYNTPGASGTTAAVQTCTLFTTVTGFEADRIVSYWNYLGSANTIVTSIRAYNAGVPGAVLRESTQGVVGSDGWKTTALTSNYTFASTTNYFLCAWANDANTELHYDGGVPAGTTQLTNAGTWPTWSAWSADGDFARVFSIYASEPTGGGGGGPEEFISTSCTSVNVQEKFDAANEDGDGVFLDCPTTELTTPVSWVAPPNSYLKCRGSTTQKGGNDLTVITDSYQSSAPLITLTTNATGTFRLYGCSLRGGVSGGNVKFGGIIAVDGFSSNFRADHITVDAMTYDVGVASTLIEFSGCVFGVVDNSIFRTSSSGNAIRHYPAQCSGSLDYGDYTWSQPTGNGGANFLYVEANDFSGNSVNTHANDCYRGGKMVFRRNTFNSSMLQTHGTAGDDLFTSGTQGGSERGCRALEIYQNLHPAATDVRFAAISQNSGTGLVWSNEVTSTNADSGFTHFHRLLAVRRTRDEYNNGPNGVGWGFCHQAPITGTVNVSGTSVTKTAGANFDTGWPTGTGGIVFQTFVSGRSPEYDPYYISSVGSTTTLTLTTDGGSHTGIPYYVGSNWDGNTNAEGYPCIDQPGRGDGDLLSGLFPNKLGGGGCNPATTNCWPNQALEPIRHWLNIWTAVSGFPGEIMEGCGSTIFTENQDCYKYTTTTCVAGGACTAGVGSGTTLPTTCTQGTAFWETDAGEWDSTNGATADGKMWTCTAPDTFTAKYGDNLTGLPYTYPHPLISGEPPPSDPPVGVMSRIRLRIK